MRTLASAAFESLSGSSKLSDDTAVRSISIGAAWLASMSTTLSVSSESSRCAASSRVELVHLLAQSAAARAGQEAHLLVRGVLGQVADVVAAVDEDAVVAVDRAETAPSDDDSLESALVGHAANPTPLRGAPNPTGAARVSGTLAPNIWEDETRVSHRVTLIPGDGTGPEIAEATRRVLEATGVELRLGRAGGRRRRHGSATAATRCPTA